MTREHKLALIVGFALILVVGVFVSDHFSKARLAKPGDQLATSAGMPKAQQNQPVAYPKVEPVVLTSSQPAPAPAVPAAPQHEPGTWTTGERPTLGGGLAGDVSAGATRGPSLAGDPRVSPTRGDLPAAAGPLVDVPSEGGVRLPIPAPHTQTSDVRTAAANPAPANSGLPVSAGELRKHTVGKGDSLAKIARKYYGDDKLWKKLAEYNSSRVTADNNVNLGVNLLIPPRDVLMGQATLAPAGTRAPAPKKTEIARNDPPKSSAKPDPKKAGSAAPTAPKPADRTYTVKSGDTLALIAERELGSGKRWREIQRLNAGTLGDDDTIAVGMVLKLPAKG